MFYCFRHCRQEFCIEKQEEVCFREFLMTFSLIDCYHTIAEFPRFKKSTKSRNGKTLIPNNVNDGVTIFPRQATGLSQRASKFFAESFLEKLAV